jgi:Putative zinc-finger
MTAEGCREWRERLGAYVLGHLPEDERAATAAHVEGCAACRAEAESLAPIAELMPKADPSRLGTAPAPPAELADRVAAQIASEGRRVQRRRRRRLAIGFSGAAATAAAAALLLAVLPGGDGTPPAGQSGARTVSFEGLPRGVTMAAVLKPTPLGTEIRIQVRGMPSGTLCRVFLRGAGDSTMPAGIFHYRYGGSERAVLTSALDLSNARAIGVRAAGRTYVAPLDGERGAQTRTTSGPITIEEEFS